MSSYTLNTKCANGKQADFVLVVSNLPTAADESDLTTLDAPYDYSLTKVGQG